MLKLLLDEHISPDVAKGLRRHDATVVVLALVEWENGTYLGQEDALLLQSAAQQGLTLVTYDRRTIPPLLKAWAEQGRSHGGVIFVDNKTISPADIGNVIKALAALTKERHNLDWTDQIAFLQR
jgi:hypothetical protein